MKEHKISLGAAILLSMNIIIGSGILIGPRLIAEISGNASFLAWPLVALLFLPLVLCTAQLSNMFPGCGGFYSYAKEGINKNAGFISGWLYIVGYTLVISVDILAIRKTFIANGVENFITLNPLIFNITFILACICLNLMNLKNVSRILNSLTISKLLPLMILILLIPFIINPNFSISAQEISMVPYSLPLAIFGYFGFEYCCSLTHLIKDSKRNAPRAILIGFIITSALYTLFHFGLLNLMGQKDLISLGAPAYAQFINFPIPYLRSFLIFLIPLASILTIFAASNGLINSNAILMQSMAQEKLFLFSPIFAKSTKNGRPWVAILLISFIALLVATFITDINVIGGISNLGVFLSFIFPFISLFIIQRKNNTSWTKLSLTLLALIITIGFIIYSWCQLGKTFNEQIISAFPIIMFFGLGYILYLYRIKNND